MYYIGIDLGGTNIAAGITDTEGRILHKDALSTGASRDKDAILEDIVTLCHMLCRDAKIGEAEIARVGIAVPGGVDAATGEILFTPNIPSFSGINICDILSAKLGGKPVLLANDANAAALAEARVGAAKGAASAVMITLGTGIGGGIIVNGRIYTGFNGLAAELGHFVIRKDGVPCSCGQRGCFETYASATALIRMTKEELDRCFVSGEGTLMAESRKLNACVAFDAYRAGDVAAKRVIEQYIGYLASGIASLINIFQPEVFIIGGGVANERQFLLDLLAPHIDAEDFARNAKKRTRIVTAVCGNDAGIIGAAMNEPC